MLMAPGLNPLRAVLGNGVTIVSRQTRKTPAVTINVALPAGAVIDPADKSGAAYLLSRVIDRGTLTRSASEIAEALDNRGISLTATASRTMFSLVCTCLSEDFEQVFALLADIIMSPCIPQGELTTRRGEVMTALRQDQDNPAVRAMEELMLLLYGREHPYGRGVKGTVGSVEALTRNDLLQLHSTRFAPDQLSVVIVGDVDGPRAQACAALAFGEWRGPTPSPVVLRAPVRSTERRFVTIPLMNKAQADVAYGFTSIARSDSRYYAFLLMNNVLGQYAMGGRLGDSIRERQGMAYYAFSGFDASVIPGPLTVRAGVAASNVDRAIASIDAELETIRTNGVTGRELAESRQYMIGSMPRALETNEGIAGFLQNAELFGLGLDYDRRLPSLLTGVTIDDVNAAATTLDPSQATIVVAGPYRAGNDGVSLAEG
jgi:zinc protease